MCFIALPIIPYGIIIALSYLLQVYYKLCKAFDKELYWESNILQACCDYQVLGMSTVARTYEIIDK